jgi:hypothetical protein
MKTLCVARILCSMLIPATILTSGLQAHGQVTARLGQLLLATISLDDLDRLEPDTAPPVGTFYLLSECLTTDSPSACPFRPPLSDGAVIYALDVEGVFLVDDTASTARDVHEAGDMNSGVQTGARSFVLTSTLSGELDFPPESDPSGGGTDPLTTSSYSSGDLWLEITAVSNDSAWIRIHTPETNGVYDLFATTNLSPMGSGLNVTTWVPVLRSGLGQTNLVVTDLTANVCFFILAKTNDTDGDAMSDAFERLVSHTDPNNGDQNTNDIPDGWEWNHFGNVDQPADGDYDGDLVSNYDEYFAGTDPNTISFALVVTNHYLNANPAPVQMTVAGGVPSSMAVLVDGTNYARATWLPYPAAVTLPGEGWHDVWIGLRGRLASSQQTWKWIRLKLDLTPPVLILTNPVSATVMQPMIQVQGFCPEALANCTYDLTNAAGLVTNQPVLVLDQFYDTNVWDFTTNTFQAFDVPLTNGPNTFTFHATDLAGNVSSTNITFTLDYSGKTNPPVIQLHWPQHGTRISGGGSYSWRGWVDDFTAQIKASLTDDEGNTNEFEAIVERDGKFWVENLPAPLGTNLLQLTVTDAAGNVSTTNISVIASPVNLSLNAPGVSADQAYAQVSGTIGSTNYTVWVNGAKAWLNGDGTWIVSNAPVSPGGTAVFQARAIPNGDNGGNGTSGGGGGSANGPAASTDNPFSTQAQDRESQQNKPASLYLASYSHHYTTTSESQEERYEASGGDCYWWSQYHYSQTGSLSWQHDSAATASYSASDDLTLLDVYDPPAYEDYHWGTTEDWWSAPFWQPFVGTEVSVQDGQQDTYPVGPPTVRMQYWEYKDRYHAEGQGWVGESYYSVHSDETKNTWHRRAVTKLFTGDKGVPGQQSLVEINAWQLINGHWADPIYVLGQLGTAWVAPPAGVTMDVTPTYNLARYDFNEYASIYTPYIKANGVDLRKTTPEFCVGQKVTLAVGWDESPSSITSSNYDWVLSAKFVNHSWQETNWAQLPPIPVGSLNFDVDPGSLKLAQPEAWYVSQGMKQVKLKLTLKFLNGRSETITTKAGLLIYRPEARMAWISSPRGYTLQDLGPVCILQLGNGKGKGDMYYRIQVDSKYPFFGDINFTQLITAGYSFPPYNFADERCDGLEFFNEMPGRATPTGIAYLDDGPFEKWVTPNVVRLSCRDFVRFKPDGDGIWVTLGVVTWNTVGVAEQDFWGTWTITTDSTPGPAGPDASDEFPRWTINQGGLR